ncbi:unnamed protein product, partial [Mycena citricolor]
RVLSQILKFLPSALLLLFPALDSGTLELREFITVHLWRSTTNWPLQAPASMAPVFVRRLENPTEDEIERCASVLLAAFNSLNDVFSHSLTGGNRDLDFDINVAPVRAALIAGQVWVAGFDAAVSDICAVALWFGPGAEYLATEEQREAGWNQLQAKFTPELKQWWSYFIPRFGQWCDASLGPGVKLRSWRLNSLGTLPEHHGQGLGAALIQAIEIKAKADNVMMVLETTTDENIRFYQNRGFLVRGEPLSILGSGGETTFTCLSKSVT